MRFSATASLLALAASASAAVLPRSQMGEWAASVTVQPNGDQYVHFEFTSDAYPEKQRSTCVYVQSETPSWKRCDQASVDYSYDGTTLKISQGLQLPNPMTVFGEAEVPLTETLEDGRKKGEAVVPVTSAIA